VLKLRCAPCAGRVHSLMVWNTVALTLAASAASAVAWADEPQIETVLVTAQKRAQSIQDVPVSVSVLGSSTIAAAGVNDITDVSREIPTLEVQSSTGSGTVNFRLRRVGNLGNIPSFEPAVGLFIDGAFRIRSFFGAGELLDLDRIEVLNGPQSTLYGKNTTAGVIAMYSRAPGNSSEFITEGTIGKADAANHPLLGDAKAVWSGPITDGWGASVAGAWSGQDYLLGPNFPGQPPQNSQSRYSSRVQLQHKSDQSTLRLILEQQGSNNRDGSPEATTFAPGPVNTLHNLLIAKGLAANCAGAQPRDYGNCLLRADTTNLQATDATLLYDYHFANQLTLSSVTSWDNYKYIGAQPDAVQLGAPILGYYDQQRGHSGQQELRLTSPGHQTVDWLAGVFYYHNDLLRGDASHPTFYGEQLAAAPFWKPIAQQLVGAPLVWALPGQNSFVDSSLATDYIAAFGQADWNVTDRFHINAGLREQRETKEAVLDQFQSVPGASLTTVLINTTIPRTELSRSVSKPTWSITPQFDFTPDTMGYFTWARGFKSGGYNTGFGRLPASQREFGDETVDDYELGVKSTLLNRRLQLHAAVFDTIYNNYQDAAFIGAQFTVGNAQKATDRGLDLGLDALLTDTLTANLDVSYANFKYATYTDGVCYPGRNPDGSLPKTCDLSGEHPINAPPLKISLALEEKWPVSFGDVFGRISADWTERYNTSFSADPRLYQTDYTWMQLRVGTDVGRAQFTLWVDNLLDKRVANVDALLNLFSNDPSTQTFMQPPRTYGLTVRVTL
jgi:iron complex outermembrane recepter protein